MEFANDVVLKKHHDAHNRLLIIVQNCFKDFFQFLEVYIQRSIKNIILSVFVLKFLIILARGIKNDSAALSEHISSLNGDPENCSSADNTDDNQKIHIEEACASEMDKDNEETSSSVKDKTTIGADSTKDTDQDFSGSSSQGIGELNGEDLSYASVIFSTFTSGMPNEEENDEDE
ncbi:hypothetical protein HNY73_020284 [Argiope bruennichi]|uniref:Uncharacterized protein n=1 Tax=Argiope bruennichi TaxID=94029 RepID=A0A8T0EA23_ARGBR|nr:hypothetical protein HNY73_020284 [Argiope bruennichi]